MEENWLSRLKRLDDERPSLPGEHWMALGAGLWLMTRRPQTALAQMAALAVGAAFVYRAMSGRDSPAKTLLRSGPPRGRAKAVRGRRPSQRFLDITAPWPAPQRVRVPAISQPVGKTIWTP